MREKTVEWALKEKIIAIVRGMEAKDCLRVAQALYDGGIRLMEITYDQRDPAQWAKTADAIGKNRFKPFGRTERKKKFSEAVDKDCSEKNIEKVDKG